MRRRSHGILGLLTPRADHLSGYRSTLLSTHHTNTLAARGVRFAQAVA